MALPTKKTRSAWTTEDSRKEMEKWTNGNVTLTPLAREVQESLSENMWFFIDNISDRCVRYREAMQNVIEKNPNNRFSQQELEASLLLDNEAKFAGVGLRRYVVTADDKQDDTNKCEQDDESAPKSVETEESTTVDADDDDDDDEDDTYDPVDDIEVILPSNKELVREMVLLKQAGSELATVFEGISDWIALSVPDIKVDDNDCVDIMKSVMEAIDAHCEAVRSTVTFHREYIDERAELEVEVTNFPHAPSLRRQLIINDLESWSEVERGWQTLTRCALIAHTLLTKNMKKLLNPRNSTRSAGIYQ